MKIYRYTYIKKVIKITEFKFAKTINGDYIICEDCKEFKKVIKKDTLDKLRDNTNYIMWSLASDHTVHFKDLIIKRKLDIFTKKLKETEDLEKEIIDLERSTR